MKRTDLVRLNEQWALFEAMTPMLRAGSLAYPRQVANELSRVQFPDTPGAWAVGAKDLVIYPDPSDEALAEVLGAAQLVDPNAEAQFEEADPYVVAMAYDIRERYSSARVIVVSDDVKDRMPRKESVATACARLDLECWQAPDLVAHVRGSILAS